MRRRWTRREVLQSGASAAAGMCLAPTLLRVPATVVRADGQVSVASAGAVGPREQFLLDFGWRFQLGNAADPDRDFAFGRGRLFAKSGQLFSAAAYGFS